MNSTGEKSSFIPQFLESGVVEKRVPISDVPQTRFPWKGLAGPPEVA